MEIIVANTYAKMRKVWRFVNSVYIDKGYISGDSDLELSHYPHLDLINQTTVFLLEDSEGTVGTISVTEDGPCGLHVDTAFRSMLFAVRDACSIDGTKLGESWRIVTRSNVRMYRQVLFSLINVAIQELIKRRLDTTLYSFHPRHENVHKKLLGFKKIDSIEHDSMVGNAPAVLMMGDLHTIIQYWSKEYGR